MQFTLDHTRRGFCVTGRVTDQGEANVNAGQFLRKRLLRLGWLILLLLLVQFFVSSATSETGLSRTAHIPPAVAVSDGR